MRIIKLKAVLTGSINDNLRRLGYSATLRARLRKKLGLIRINEESKIITDFIKEGLNRAKKKLKQSNKS